MTGTTRIQGIVTSLLLLGACGGSEKPANTAATATEPEPNTGTEAHTEVEEPLLDFDPESLVKFSLVADTHSIENGQALTLAGRFEVLKGWHIYWINPGDSGLATKIKVEPSSEVSISAPSFPGPIRFASDGDIINYGYAGTVIVPMKAEVLSDAASITVQASATWLACREDACVPGKGGAKLVLGAGSNPKALGGPPLATALAALPKPVLELVEFGGKVVITPDDGESDVAIDVPLGTEMHLFPLDDASIRKAVQHSDDSGLHGRWTLVTKSTNADVAILSIRGPKATRFFTITNAHLQGMHD